ncbi:hypothetical protein MMC18_005868 [Xylographa bjoerkii]|nr:hypothetical protein [Xylographa bjoerkii]
MASSSTGQLAVPLKTSIKRRADEATLDELVDKMYGLTGDIQKMRKKLKPGLCYDASYWIGRSEVQRKLSERTKLQKEISLANFEQAGAQPNMSWENSSEWLALLEREKAYDLETPSKAGLGIITSVGKRDASDQGNFRQNLIAAYQSAHPDKRKDALWCPLIGDWVMSENARAAHIFPHEQGSSMFRSIFGLEDSIYSINNGIIMSSYAEQRFDKGFFVIVPMVADEDTPESIATWIKSEPKEYKIRVVNPQGANMATTTTPQSNKTWNDLDGAPLVFRSQHRPKARYLYWHYCQTILRRSWVNQKAENVLRDELGRPYWGTPGPFMRKQMLLAFVEEMGHAYDKLLDGAEEDGTDEAVETALVAANHVKPDWSSKLSYPQLFPQSKKRGGLNWQGLLTPSSLTPKQFAQTRETVLAEVTPKLLRKLVAKEDEIGLQKLLNHHFEEVSQQDFEWLHELKHIGYTSEEIATLLLSDQNDSPWIYITTADQEERTVLAGFHQPGCVHCGGLPQELPLTSLTTLGKDVSAPESSSESGSEVDAEWRISESCGLAGILPISRDPSEWNGQVTFTGKKNTTAWITYRMPASNEASAQRDLLERASKAMRGACSAIGNSKSGASAVIG